MPKSKGDPKSGGRTKGTPNKTTQAARELFIETLAGEMDNIKTALQEIYEKDKKDYLNILSKYMPYFAPRQEHIDLSNVDGTLKEVNHIDIFFREPVKPSEL